jgi:hypothetical protein
MLEDLDAVAIIVAEVADRTANAPQQGNAIDRAGEVEVRITDLALALRVDHPLAFDYYLAADRRTGR